MVRTGKIDDVRAYRMLSPEFVFFEPPIAQSRPHPPLCVCRALPQMAGSLARHRLKVPAGGK